MKYCLNEGVLYNMGYIIIQLYILWLFYNIIGTFIIEYRGIAAAYNQIGVLRNIFIVRVSGVFYNVFICPKLVWISRVVLYYFEGCLSIDKYFVSKGRFKYIIIVVVGYDGVLRKYYLYNFLSICIQHEYSHLKGILLCTK